WRMEPPVSEPRAPKAELAATAAAEPPEDPPGTRVMSHGLKLGPQAEFSVDEPMANSSRLVLPTITAPASRRRVTTVASYGGTYPARIWEAAVVSRPRVHMLSFNAIGMPWRGPRSLPAARSASAASAAARAPSRSMFR